LTFVTPLCRLYDKPRRSVSNSYAIERTLRAMMMTKPSALTDAELPFQRGICLVVRGQRVQRHQPAGSFPQRPSSRVLSESIPLFFVALNKTGFWVAREAEGRIGGIFLLKRSALRFAQKNSADARCATMFPTERFELDVENQGNPLIGWLHKTLVRASKLIPDHPPAVPIRRGVFTGEHR
jgi:hypothetical protein